jgi:glycosyltransferase involved in cell wall biosynthesis
MVVHIFGGGPLLQQLEDFIDTKKLSSCVNLHGFIEPEKAAGYLKSVNALIIPSRIESIPVVLSDALQANTPIIATDVGDMGFLLKEYRAGAVVPPEAPEELARAIEHHMSVADHFYEGRKALLELFRIPNTVDRLLKTLKP